MEAKIHTIPKEQRDAFFAEFKKRIVGIPFSKDIKKRFDDIKKNISNKELDNVYNSFHI